MLLSVCEKLRHLLAHLLAMLVENRRDLVVSSMVGPETSPEAVLDAFQPDWRTRHESEFEVFTAADGQRSIRAKRS